MSAGGAGHSDCRIKTPRNEQTAALLGVSPAVLDSLCFPSSLGRLRVMDLPPRRLDASPQSLLPMSVTLADESLPSWSQSSHRPATGKTSHMSPDSPKMNPDCPDKLGMYPWPLVEPITPRLSARGDCSQLTTGTRATCSKGLGSCTCSFFRLPPPGLSECPTPFPKQPERQSGPVFFPPPAAEPCVPSPRFRGLNGPERGEESGARQVASPSA
uniref:Uncharacterized protein n=1 Tax=Molossus molossus TaxID=27622 RepID=A0A7J8DQ53_MOLMO|nr:hypothetical protein HJG59_009234 [Molossus molossus]